MIVSASRRTDIPAFYAEWFMQRLREGYALVANPFNAHQVRRVVLTPDAVDGFVFWSKNPAPMLKYLQDLRDYAYYFQFTLNAYGKDIEAGLPSRRELLDTFFRLSAALGPERVVWRYDPIFVNSTYTKAFHLDAFANLANSLSSYTQICNVSFMSLYASTKRNMRALEPIDPDNDEKRDLLEQMGSLGKQAGVSVRICAQELDAAGVTKARCVDPSILQMQHPGIGHIARDPNQRQGCACAQSVDIGTYATCLHGCRYCYAIRSSKILEKNLGLYSSSSALLCGQEPKAFSI